MPNREEFAARIREYYRECTDYQGKRYTQAALASRLIMDPADLSRKLHDPQRGKLSHTDVRQIVLVLAEWSAIRTQQQARELLSLMDCPDFSPADWASPPLNLLEREAQTQTHAPTRVSTPPRSQTAESGPHGPTLRVAGNSRLPITQLVWSPDGRYLAYTDSEGALYVLPVFAHPAFPGP